MALFRRKSAPAGFSLLHDWFATPAGRRIAQQEQVALNQCLPTVFGYHLLMLAPPWAEVDLSASRIGHTVRVYPRTDKAIMSTDLLAFPHALPVLTDSVDAVVLAHTLEVSRNPHQVLREVDRVLIPNGHLVLFGFNPWGTWGAWRMLARWRGRAPWTVNMIGLPRLRDWLSLLGFETITVMPVAHRLPVFDKRTGNPAGWLQKGGQITAACYGLVARKREIGLTPVRPKWRRRSLLKPRLVEPTTRKAGYGRNG